MAVAGNQAQELKQRIENRTARVGIIGLGYVGLPLALLFSEKDIRVTGFDIDEAKVTTLNGGGSYIVRISPAAGLRPLLLSRDTLYSPAR